MATEILNWDEPPPARCRDGALAIGNFDGVHRGHQALLAELRRQAGRISGPAVVLTFDPHPLQILRPERFQPLLTTVDYRAALLQQHGADHVAVLQTTPSFLQLTAREFFTQVVGTAFRARAVIEGPNFGFGRDREGTVETLAGFCGEAGVALTVLSVLAEGGKAVSSSRVRSALVRGAVGEAAELLARPYRLRGTVGTGQKRGQGLGFPTANLQDIATLVPGDGVYAVRVHRKGDVWPGAANIGPNPTFGEQARKVEVHLIGFQGDLYGELLAVDFIDRLRDTRPFPSVAELVEQLRRDVEQAQTILQASRRRD
jgi:riboflavin kinase/FMN adenylyltransferase